MSPQELGGMGWRPDLPDFRDYTPKTDKIADVLKKSQPLKKVTAGTLPPAENLTYWCPDIENQGPWGSCTAQAGVGLLEYYEKRTSGEWLDASRSFLYYVTRRLLNLTGDTGAYIRTTMQAMILFGIPPEEYWPYELKGLLDVDPPGFIYAMAQNYKTLQYYRHDPAGTTAGQVLDSVRSHIAAQLPCMFGFTVYSSIPPIGAGTGDIPFPTPQDHVLGGHAVVAVGYDDARKINKDTGALLIRNSWGTAWGDKGYGWLPYAYVEKGLARDFWSVLQADWVNTALFKIT
jgi:C1A family cysteine protease